MTVLFQQKENSAIVNSADRFLRVCPFAGCNQSHIHAVLRTLPAETLMMHGFVEGHYPTCP